jgi:hypothetical protein
VRQMGFFEDEIDDLYIIYEEKKKKEQGGEDK